MPTAQQPSVGRVVHYVSYGTPGGEYGSECRAAVITVVPRDAMPGVAGLAVLNPGGMFFNPVNAYDEGEPGSASTRLCDGLARAGGTWHWPARAGES